MILVFLLIIIVIVCDEVIKKNFRYKLDFLLVCLGLPLVYKLFCKISLMLE
jgi:hypothetical protein